MAELFPRKENDLGWTLDPAWLREFTHALPDDWPLNMEQVELVLLAAEKYLAATKGGQ